MNKLFFLFLFPFYCFGQTSLEQNSIGLASVSGYEEKGVSYILIDAAFPRTYLINDSQELNNQTFEQFTNIKIYNIAGSYLLLDTTGTFKFKMQFWCDNDGGTQYRPTTQLKIDTYDLLGDYLVDYELQNLLGFAVADLNKEIKSVKMEGEKPLVTLNTDTEDFPNAFIWTTPDDAENCDGKPRNNIMIFLKTAKGNYSMRCCGP